MLFPVVGTMSNLEVMTILSGSLHSLTRNPNKTQVGCWQCYVLERTMTMRESNLDGGWGMQWGTTPTESQCEQWTTTIPATVCQGHFTLWLEVPINPGRSSTALRPWAYNDDEGVEPWWMLRYAVRDDAHRVTAREDGWRRWCERREQVNIT